MLVIAAAGFAGSKTPKAKVRPHVVEVDADTARRPATTGIPLRLVRHRNDLTPDDVDTPPTG